jgi:DNA-directed RNA polymerase subunit RPC12/RpoP
MTQAECDAKYVKGPHGKYVCRSCGSEVMAIDEVRRGRGSRRRVRRLEKERVGSVAEKTLQAFLCGVYVLQSSQGRRRYRFSSRPNGKATQHFRSRCAREKFGLEETQEVREETAVLRLQVNCDNRAYVQ